MDVTMSYVTQQWWTWWFAVYLFLGGLGAATMAVAFLTDMYLKKKKRGFLSYTPIGMVVHATHSAAVRDLWKKIDIVELSVEMEISDLVTGEVLAAAITEQQGLRKQDGKDWEIVSWQELDAFFETLGARIACNLENSRKHGSDFVECSDIVIEPEYPEED